MNELHSKPIARQKDLAERQYGAENLTCYADVMTNVARAGEAAHDATSEWMVAHRALSRLARERAAFDAEEGRCLLAALRSEAHVHLGFASFTEYVERLFGYGRRCTQEKLRVAEALEHLPALARALSHGELTWSALREITRVAVPGTERAWLDVAHGKTNRQLEELVAGKQPGDTPSEAEPSERDRKRRMTADDLAR